MSNETSDSLYQLSEILNEIPPEIYENAEKFSNALESYTTEILREQQKWNLKPIYGGSSNRTTPTEQERREFRKQANKVIYNPIVQNILEQYTSFTFGGGLTEPSSENGAVYKHLKLWWNHPDNKLSLTTLKAQHQLTRKVWECGEIIVAFFVSQHTGKVRCRLFDSEKLQEIVTSEDDCARKIFYKINNKYTRTYNYAKGTFTNTRNKKGSTFTYFADVHNVDWGKSRLAKKIVPIIKGPDEAQLENGAILFIPFNNDAEDLRGIPMLLSMITALDQHKFQGEQLRTYIRTLVTFAAKKTIKDTPVNMLKSFVNQNRPTLNKGNSFPNNPQPPVGSTMFTNDKVDYDLVDVPNGGIQAFKEGIGQSLTGVSAGSGLLKSNLTNDSGYGAVSKDSALELPQLMRFRKFQFLMRDVYKEVLSIVLAISAAHHKIPNVFYTVDDGDKYAVLTNPANVDLSYTLNMPSVIQRNITQLASGLSVAVTQLGLPKPIALRLFVSEFDINQDDLDAALVKVNKELLDSIAESDVNPKLNKVVEYIKTLPTSLTESDVIAVEEFIKGL